MNGRFTRPVRFADIERHAERLESYTGLYHAYAVVLYPRIATRSSASSCGLRSAGAG